MQHEVEDYAQAVAWILEYARSQGFSLRCNKTIYAGGSPLPSQPRPKSKWVDGDGGDVFSRRLVCSCAGSPSANPEEDARPSQRCECRFSALIKRNTNAWVVTIVNAEHSHQVAIHPNMLAQHRRMSNIEKIRAVELSRKGLTVEAIARTIMESRADGRIVLPKDISQCMYKVGERPSLDTLVRLCAEKEANLSWFHYRVRYRESVVAEEAIAVAFCFPSSA
jgi:hypothetical protein